MFQASALESTMNAVLDVTIEAIFETVLEIACETVFETILEMLYESTVSEAPSNLPSSGDLIKDLVTHRGSCDSNYRGPFEGVDPFQAPETADPYVSLS